MRCRTPRFNQAHDLFNQLLVIIGEMAALIGLVICQILMDALV